MRRKIVSGILVSTLSFLGCAGAAIPVRAEDAPADGKPYIIVAEDAGAYAAAEEQVGGSITDGTQILAENNVIVADLTEQEAAELQDRLDVIVEEDIVLSADAQDGGSGMDDEMDPVELEEAVRKKSAIKPRGQEAPEEGPSGEEGGTEYEWNLEAIGADGAAGAAGAVTGKVRVALLDSGVDYVEGINQAGYVNFVDEGTEYSPIFQDETGHGTAVASIIAGNGASGVYGVDPNVELYSVKVLDGENRTPLSRVIHGIYWCIENGMDIINMSFGTPVYSQAFHQAVSDAYDAGLLMVAAAGNDGGSVEYPAAFGEVMAVASTDTQARISGFSNTGEELDVAAPGERIKVAGFFNGTQVTHGTSIAAPHVTGVAALLWEKDPTKPNEFIRQLIAYSAKEIEGTDECGLLDAGYALSIYDTFAEQYEEAQESGAAEVEGVPGNTAEPETYEDVDTDEAYAEGLWSGSNHTATISGNTDGLSTAAIKAVKDGIVYPDDADYLKNGRYHSCWHGKWEVFQYKAAAANEFPINYIAVCEMVTRVALAGGDTSGLACGDILGMDTRTYNELVSDIQLIKADCASLYPNNTTENTKYFLYGCGLHGLTDVFAHSTAIAENGEIIGHNYASGDLTDHIDYYSKRYKIASKVGQYAMDSLREGLFTDGDEVVRALKSQYTDSPKFKIIRVKKYANQNGYTSGILSQATISTDVLDYVTGRKE